MKKILTVSLLLMIISSSYACEFCGCGVGNFYLGIMPQFHKQFIGVRYQAQWYNSHVGLHPSLATREFFQTTEVWGRFYPTKRLQVITLVPYLFNQQRSTTNTVYLDGLGDIPVLVNYNVINTGSEDETRALRHSAWVGGGVKLPTGKYRFVESADTGANANFQLGTGSVDFMVNGMYTLRYEKWGLNADATYKINTYNSNDYRFGNKINGTISLAYLQQLNTIGLMPNAGIFLDHAARNFSGDVRLSDTGGTATFITGGVETYWKSVSMGVNYRVPVSQDLANGRIRAHDRMMVHLTFLF